MSFFKRFFNTDMTWFKRYKEKNVRKNIIEVELKYRKKVKKLFAWCWLIDKFALVLRSTTWGPFLESTRPVT